MNKKWKFWLGLITGAIIGGLVGYFSGDFSLEGIFSEILLYIWFPYDMVFVVFALISFILMILTLKILLQIPKMNLTSQGDQEQVLNPSESLTARAVMYVSIFVNIALFWLFFSSSVSANTQPGDPFENILRINVSVALAVQIISVILFYLVLRLHNRIYPKRQMDFYSNNPQQSYFAKLDEAEKWIVYMASYRVFSFMQVFLLVSIVVLCIHSLLFDNPQLFAMLVLFITLIAMNIKYYVEAMKKYRKDFKSK